MPTEQIPIQPVETPILCSPYREPDQHWGRLPHRAAEAIAGRSDRTKFRNRVLGPLLDQGLIEMTIPDRPRSSEQHYRLTGAGTEYLKNPTGRNEEKRLVDAIMRAVPR